MCVGQKMSNSHAEPQGHSHKDKRVQGLHQRLDIPQREGFGERSRVNTFSAQFKVQARARRQQNGEGTGREDTHVVCTGWVKAFLQHQAEGNTAVRAKNRKLNSFDYKKL